MRGVMKETVELGGYTFKKDDTILCRSRAVHLNDEEYENAKEFVPTRFMTDEGGRMTEKSSSWMPFGGGTSQCFGEEIESNRIIIRIILAILGRHFAQFHMKIFLATLLKNFHFELDTNKSHLPVKLSEINRGFGLRRPKGDIFVKVTRV